MRSILRFLNLLYSIYVLLLFFLVLIPILIWTLATSWLPERTRLLCFYRSNRFWVFITSLLTGIWFRVENKEKKDAKETYVIVGNHCNMMDILMGGSLIMHPMLALGKEEMAKVPLVGQIFNLVCIPVDRSSKESRLLSLELMVAALRRGTSVFILPEGTRNRTEEPLKDFYNGAFSVAIAAQKPIMPFVFLNSRSMQPVSSFRAYPGVATLKYLDPVPTEGMTEADVPRLKEQVYRLLWNTIVTEDRHFQGREKR